jgi:hypothetical protein
MSKPLIPDLVIDFSNPLKSEKLRKRIDTTVFNGMDLGSGYHPSMVWTTQDGKKIPIPHLTDQHLINIVNLFRRNVPTIKALAVRELLLSLGQQFSDFPLNPTDFDISLVRTLGNSEINTLTGMSDDDLLGSDAVLLNVLAEGFKRGIIEESNNVQLPASPWRQ